MQDKILKPSEWLDGSQISDAIISISKSQLRDFHYVVYPGDTRFFPRFYGDFGELFPENNIVEAFFKKYKEIENFKQRAKTTILHKII